MTGLVQEARIAAGPGMTVICSSSDPQQLRALLAVFDPSTIRGVISFGVAGGLDPSLKSGDVVVATEVVAGDARWLAGLALSEELIDGPHWAPTVVRAGLAGVEQVVVGQAGKAALHSETGASAVDMESHIAAAYAAEAGLPFAALRVISDPATAGFRRLQERHQAERHIDLQKVLAALREIRDAACAGIDRDRFQPRAAQPARLPGLSAGRREPCRGGNLTALAMAGLRDGLVSAGGDTIKQKWESLGGPRLRGLSFAGSSATRRQKNAFQDWTNCRRPDFHARKHQRFF